MAPSAYFDACRTASDPGALHTAGHPYAAGASWLVVNRSRWSIENVSAIRDVCTRHGTLFILDACRYAENAWFVKQREPGSYARLPYDPRADFTFIGGMWQLPNVLSARKDLFSSDLRELLAAFKREPRKYTYASA